MFLCCKTREKTITTRYEVDRLQSARNVTEEGVQKCTVDPSDLKVEWTKLGVIAVGIHC